MTLAEVMAEKLKISRYTQLSASGIFSAGLFLLVLGVFFGSKCIVAGQAFLFTSLGLVVFKKRGEFELSRMSVSAWFLVAFFIFALVSILVNWKAIDNPFDYIKKLRYYILIPAVIIVPAFASEFENHRWRRDLLILAWLGGFFIATAVGMSFWAYQPALTAVGAPNRFSGLYGQVMTFSYILQFTVIAMGGILISVLPWKKLTRIPRWLVWPLFLLSGLALYFSETRGAALGVGGAVVTIGAMFSLRRMALMALLLCIIAGGVFYLNSSSHFFKFDKSESERINLWRAAALTSLESPVFGLGFRNFEVQSRGLKERYGFDKEAVLLGGEMGYMKGHAHNNFFEAFASCGMLGGMAFVGFVSFWFREAWQSRFAKFFVPLIVAFVVSGLVENTFFDSEAVNAILLIYLFSQWAFYWEKSHPLTRAIS